MSELRVFLKRNREANTVDVRLIFAGQSYAEAKDILEATIAAGVSNEATVRRVIQEVENWENLLQN